jgi:type VI secretion system VasD/TssJ family lipoprotein
MKAGALVVVLVVFIACGSKKNTQPAGSSEIEPEDWYYQENAIQLVLRADPQLHLHNGVPHTLHLCFYQLRDPNAFNQMTEDEDGLYLLLNCGTFDASVTSFKALQVQPGQVFSQRMDRAEGSRYVGIAAGYYNIERERIIRSLKIPVKIKRKGPLFIKKYAVPAVLKLEITLGPQQIEKVERTK